MFENFVSVIFAFVLAVLVALLLWTKSRQQTNDKNYPPGPKGLPFLGYLPFLMCNQVNVVEKLKKKFGDVVMFPAGSENVVVLNSVEAIMDAFKGDKFSGKRNPFKVVDHMFDYRGIISEEGSMYKVQRKFISNLFKDLLNDNSSFTNCVLMECQNLVNEVRKLGDKPFCMDPLMQKAAINMFSSFCMSVRYEFDDPKVAYLADLLERLDAYTAKTYLADFFPWIERYVPRFLNGINVPDGIKKEMDVYLDKTIDDHLKTFDEHNIRDFTDAYLAQIRFQAASKTPLHLNPFDRESLKGNLLSMHIAGMLTISEMLTWLLKLLLSNPRVLKRLTQEIDDKVGRDRSPSWQEHLVMPYTVATFHEALRYANIPVFGVLHTNIENVKVLDFDIPKRSNVLVNYVDAHGDPKIWGDPENFRPERFIDEISGKIINTEKLFVFGIGRRSCIGKAIAQMEMFHFLIAILQNFTIHLSDGTTEGFDRHSFTKYLLPFNIVAKSRK